MTIVARIGGPDTVDGDTLRDLELGSIALEACRSLTKSVEFDPSTGDCVLRCGGRNGQHRKGCARVRANWVIRECGR